MSSFRINGLPDALLGGYPAGPYYPKIHQPENKEINMNKPYVYKLIHKETGQFYIGYRSANIKPPSEDLSIYRTSSNLIHEIGFDNFNWQIVAELESADAAYELENVMIEECINDPLCLNRHFTKSGKMHFRRNGPFTEEAKAKLAKSMTGKKLSEETLAKLRKPLSEERKAKLRGIKRNRPKTLSDEHKANISKGIQKRYHPE